MSNDNANNKGEKLKLYTDCLGDVHTFHYLPFKLVLRLTRFPNVRSRGVLIYSRRNVMPWPISPCAECDHCWKH
jgi:hypothetical protein